MLKLKNSDFTPEVIEKICEILNKGDEAHIKREKDNVVVVKIKRECLIKSQIGYKQPVAKATDNKNNREVV